MTDLLLLNASNLPQRPVYPYAFVQLRALATRHGLTIATHDLLGVAEAAYRTTVKRLLDIHRPRMIGLTLRQMDSVVYRDYAGRTSSPGYFPVVDSASLVSAIRDLTDVPIVIGGFGFTTNADQLFARIDPDLGVVGEPDALFERFDDVVSGRVAGVANLLYRDRGIVRRGVREYAGPFDEREYDDHVVDELEAFYGRSHLYAEGGPTVAVELARGCPYRCYFCTEPTVKGREVRERDIDVVMAEVEFLARRGLRRFWLVCSELNLGNADLAMRVAERFRQFNDRGPHGPVSWHAYHLPRWLGARELGELYRSGFAGGWNDFPSLDDSNLRACRVPYRTRHVVEHLRLSVPLAAASAVLEPPRFSVFLGNAFATPSTVAESLRVFNEAALGRHFVGASVAEATRMFPVENASVVDSSDLSPRTWTSDGRVPEDPTPSTTLADPTFYFPPAIVRALGEPHDVEQLFRYVERSLLDVREPRVRRWELFLASAGLPWLADQLVQRMPRRVLPRGVSDDSYREVEDALARLHREPEAALSDLLVGSAYTDEVRRFVMALIIHRLSHPAPPGFLAALDALGVDHDGEGRVHASAYELSQILLPRFASNAELLAHVGTTFGFGDGSLEIWLFRKLLFRTDLQLDARHREFVLSPGRSTSGRWAEVRASNPSETGAGT